MDPHVAEAIAPLIALIGFGTFTLIGLRMYLAHKAKRLELGVPAAEQDAALRALQDEVHMLRGDVAELQERLDFAERLLTRGQEP